MIPLISASLINLNLIYKKKFLKFIIYVSTSIICVLFINAVILIMEFTLKGY